MFTALRLPLPGFMSPHEAPLVFAVVQFFLTVPVIWAGSRFFTVGMKAHSKRAPNMDTLVAIGTGSAFLYSTFALVMIALGNHAYAANLYFESAAVVITLVMFGKYLEALSRGKTSEAIKKLITFRRRPPSCSRTARRSRWRLTSCWRATLCSCGREAPSRSTARCSRAFPPSTNPCSPAKACLSKSTPGAP